MLIKHLLIFLVIIGLVCLYYALGITCPFYYLFKIPCPTCGITRSLICLLKLDLKGYLHYNALSVPVVIAFLLVIHINILKGKLRKIALTFSLIVFILNLIYYIYRLVLFLQ